MKKSGFLGDFMSESRFTIKFDGPAIVDGEIDVTDFAPAVLHLGELVRTTNEVINKDRTEAKVKLKATHEGSFEALLMLDVDVLKAASDFFSDRDKIAHAQSILNLLLSVGTFGGGVGGGLLWLLKVLKGKKPEKVEKTDGGVYLTINGDVYLMQSGVVDLYQDSQVRQKVESATQVLERPGIDSLSFMNEDESASSLAIEKQERQYFELPEVEETQEETVVRKDVMFLKALSIHFKEGNKWRFTDGDSEFYANIEDIDFLNKIDNGEIRFLKGDVYECEVVTTQTITANNTLKSERTIKRVIEHHSGSHQLKLL